MGYVARSCWGVRTSCPVPKLPSAIGAGMVTGDAFATQRDLPVDLTTELTAAGFEHPVEIGKGGFGVDKSSNVSRTDTDC